MGFKKFIRSSQQAGEHWQQRRGPCVGFCSLLSFLVCVLIGQILKPELALSESSTRRTGADRRPSSLFFV